MRLSTRVGSAWILLAAVLLSLCLKVQCAQQQPTPDHGGTQNGDVMAAVTAPMVQQNASSPDEQEAAGSGPDSAAQANGTTPALHRAHHKWTHDYGSPHRPYHSRRHFRHAAKHGHGPNAHRYFSLDDRRKQQAANAYGGGSKAGDDQDQQPPAAGESTPADSKQKGQNPEDVPPEAQGNEALTGPLTPTPGQNQPRTGQKDHRKPGKQPATGKKAVPKPDDSLSEEVGAADGVEYVEYEYVVDDSTDYEWEDVVEAGAEEEEVGEEEQEEEEQEQQQQHEEEEEEEPEPEEKEQKKSPKKKQDEDKEQKQEKQKKVLKKMSRKDQNKKRRQEKEEDNKKQQQQEQEQEHDEEDTEDKKQLQEEAEGEEDKKQLKHRNEQKKPTKKKQEEGEERQDELEQKRQHKEEHRKERDQEEETDRAEGSEEDSGDPHHAAGNNQVPGPSRPSRKHYDDTATGPTEPPPAPGPEASAEHPLPSQPSKKPDAAVPSPPRRSKKPPASEEFVLVREPEPSSNPSKRVVEEPTDNGQGGFDEEKHGVPGDYGAYGNAGGDYGSDGDDGGAGGASVPGVGGWPTIPTDPAEPYPNTPTASGCKAGGAGPTSVVGTALVIENSTQATDHALKAEADCLLEGANTYQFGGDCELQCTEASDYGLVQLVRLSIQTGGAGQTVCGAIRHNMKVPMMGICSIIPVASCCEPTTPDKALAESNTAAA